MTIFYHIQNYSLNDSTQQNIIYNIVLKATDHLLKQNERSYDLSGCLYRSPNGLMCAVGALISDEFYEPSFENVCVSDSRVFNSVIESNPVLKTLDTSHLFYFDQVLAHLQSVHDDKPVEEWVDHINHLLKSINSNHVDI